MQSLTELRRKHVEQLDKRLMRAIDIADEYREAKLQGIACEAILLLKEIFEVEQPMERFVAKSENEDGMAWSVRDNMANTYNMPVKAVSMNMTRESAIRVAAIMNREWTKFLHNPS